MTTGQNLERAKALLKKMIHAHADPDNGGQYNDCDREPCQWCADAKAILDEECHAEAKFLIYSLTKRAWWLVEARGCTESLAEAGRFFPDEVGRWISNSMRSVAVPEVAAETFLAALRGKEGA